MVVDSYIFFHWHYSPLWALACRTMSFHFFLSATNSLHLLTPSTWRALSTSAFHPYNYIIGLYNWRDRFLWHTRWGQWNTWRYKNNNRVWSTPNPLLREGEKLKERQPNKNERSVIPYGHFKTGTQLTKSGPQFMSVSITTLKVITVVKFCFGRFDVGVVCATRRTRVCTHKPYHNLCYTETSYISISQLQ